MNILFHTYEARKAYMLVFHYKPLMDNRSRKIAKVLELSSLPKTSTSILDTIAKDGKLLVSEIAKRIKKSERAVRKHLAALTRKGFLNRKIEVTKNKKLAYRYEVKPWKEVIRNLKQDLIMKIHKLNKLAK